MEESSVWKMEFPFSPHTCVSLRVRRLPQKNQTCNIPSVRSKMEESSSSIQQCSICVWKMVLPFSPHTCVLCFNKMEEFRLSIQQCSICVWKMEFPFSPHTCVSLRVRRLPQKESIVILFYFIFLLLFHFISFPFFFYFFFNFMSGNIFLYYEANPLCFIICVCIWITMPIMFISVSQLENVICIIIICEI